MLKLSKAYCCERVPRCRELPEEAVWSPQRFGRRKWVSLKDLVSACNRSPLVRDHMWTLDLITQVLADLGERAWRRRFRWAPLPDVGNWSAFARRTATEIDAAWEGTLDYC